MDSPYEWALQRIGPISEEVIFYKSFLSFGRMKEQDVTCLSLLVSRKHCEFTIIPDGLSVMDLGSSNGVYVNGHKISSMQRYILKENDIVGIGCFNSIDLDDTMFVYKVKRSTNSNSSHSRKRQSGTLQSSTPVPAKIQKLSSTEGDEIEIIEPVNNNSDVIQNKGINPFSRQAAKVSQKVAASSTKQVVERDKGNVCSRPEVRECSSTSNIDNEVREPSISSTKTIENQNSSKIAKNLKNNVPKPQPELIDLSESDLVNIKIEPMQMSEVGTSDINLTKEEVEENAQTEECPPSVEDSIDSAEVGTTNQSTVEQELINNESHLASTDDCNEEFEAEGNVDENVVNNIKMERDALSNYSQIDLVELDDDGDDFFPSSQLFNKSIVKEELEEDAVQTNSSLFLDDDDENIITVEDSDEEINEDSNYYAQLAQLIKSEPPSEHEVAETIVPDMIDPLDNMEFENLDQIANEIASSSTRVEIAKMPISVAVDSTKVLASNKNADCSARMESVDPFDGLLQPSNEQASSLLHEELSAPSTSKNVISSPSAKPKKKGVEIIEPHHMKPKSRRRSSDAHSPKKRDKKSRKHKSSLSSSKKSSHRSSSKSKDKDKSSSRSHKTSSESKEKKDKDNTNDSINQSTSSSKKSEESEKPKNKMTIVKAKVSARSRGDMLCESMVNLRPTPRTVTKKPTKESVKTPATTSGVVLPRRDVSACITQPAIKPMINQPSEVRDNESHASNLFDSLSRLNVTHTSSISRQENMSSVLQNATNSLNLPSSSSSNVRASPDIDSMSNDVDTHVDSPPRKAPSTSSVQNGSRKTVSFKENIASVKEFPIDPGNSLRNIKDNKKIVKEVPKPNELKIEDFLARVFAWEPAWLEQQQKVKHLPPIVDNAKLLPLPNTFNSFEQYYKKMEVLLLLETWQLLLKEYECSGSKYSASQVLCCAIDRESIKQQLTPNRLRYSQLDVKTIVTKKELTMKTNPVYGDMIILEYMIQVNGQTKWRRAFAYVIEVRQQNSLRSLPSTHPLFKRVNNPHAIITYTLQTRVIDEHTIQFEQLARFRSILYLRPHLRSIKGLQYVIRSSLRDSILHVDIDEYRIDPDGFDEKDMKASIKNYTLLTKDKLNEKQTEAVIKFTDAATNMKSKIGILIGPPGTGKSRVVTNLVIQMLYGDNRFRNGTAHRILVCAPSNAAIDEIVLRLLEIRAAIKDREDRFRMVRIGREECMHEEVKKISVADLARKEANRQYAGNKQKHLEETEHKKQMLLKTIKSLNDLIASDPHGRGKYEIELQNKRAKYEKLSFKSPEADQIERNKLETAAKTTIIHKAHVIACTLSSCYNGQMEAIFGGHTDHIATCIVDEATQCCEADTLIPLMLGVKNLFLVGDPNQLPATVMSTDAKALGLDRSLFTRAKDALESQLDTIRNKKDPVIMLTEQYRMVSPISYWPNKYFYKGKLVDRVLYKDSFPYHAYRILNVDGVQDDTKFSNKGEAIFVGNLVNALMTCEKVSQMKTKISIGIITPYQNQRQVILSTVKEQTRSVPQEIKSKFETECNTIDSFQGQERDVIIMSCVRSHGIGFLSDPQRLCVALTRAKHTLIICGNLTPFHNNKMWDDLLRDGRSRGLVVNLHKKSTPNNIKPHVISYF